MVIGQEVTLVAIIFSRTSLLFRPSVDFDPRLHRSWWLFHTSLRPKILETQWANTTMVANMTTTASGPVGSFLSANISALPTPIDPKSCILHMSPVYYLWVPNPTAPPVGTKFVYVTANQSAISTSTTCDQDAYFSQKDWRYAVDMGTDCSFTGAMPNIKYDEDKIWTSNTVTFPGPTSELSIGNMLHLKWYWPTSDGWWSTHLSTAKVYTEKDWSVTDTIYARMPSLPKYYPEIADVLRNFSLTPTSTAAVAAPVITPAPSLPRVTAAPGFATTVRPHPAGPVPVYVSNAGDNIEESTSDGINDAAVSNPGEVSSNHVEVDLAAAVAGNAVDIIVNSEHFLTVTYLVLPGGITARPGSSPVTIRDRIVSLDRLGMVHIASVSTSLPGDAENDNASPVSNRKGQARSVVVPLSEIARIGSMDALGTYIPVSIERYVTQPEHSGDGGTGTGQQGSRPFGLFVSSMGKWIAAGLGSSGSNSLEDGVAFKGKSDSPAPSGAGSGSPVSTNDVAGSNESNETAPSYTGNAPWRSSTPWMSALLACVFAALAMTA
ncbi:hypothetical protein KVT40_000079 [Elsinoe batatas]|uniref:Uncharacterized protein n=1 Tax=Elsinoe batatas TaxID=2601811 RepID=A0A8K0L9E7_9PEZI|nr:hypothetical protein KVT40_000079 [Elsinoe batatas]